MVEAAEGEAVGPWVLPGTPEAKPAKPGATPATSQSEEQGATRKRRKNRRRVSNPSTWKGYICKKFSSRARNMSTLQIKGF